MTFSASHLRYSLRLFLILMTVIFTCINSSLAEPVNEQKRPISTFAVIHCDYAPVSFWDKITSTPSGFFVDIIDSVAERAGLRVSYICRNSWDEAIAAIESGQADLGVLLKSEEREKRMLFSNPIDTTYLSFFARSRSNVDPARVPYDHVVGVIKGSMSHELLKDRKGVRLQIYGGYREGLFGLLAGEIGLFAGEESMILKQMRETDLEDRIEKVGKPFVELQRCLVVCKDNVQLLALINKTLKEFVGGPEYQKLYLKWYGAPKPYWTKRRVLAVNGVFLIIAISGIALWRYATIYKVNAMLSRAITERKRAEDEIKRLNDDLLAKNESLEFTNKELESFIYSVSHDLRTPLRAISGFSSILMKDIADKLDEKGKRYLSRIHDGTEKMSRLIDDLLSLSRISRQEIQRREVNVSGIAASIANELREANPGRRVEVNIKENLTAFADPGLIEIALSNLLGNAWKFTTKTAHARIEFGAVEQDGKVIYYVRDNGAGFNQKYAEKMFWPFHRLHSEAAFEGTGIGLAIVDRIIRLHGGKVRAEGIEGKGATIYFSLN